MAERDGVPPRRPRLPSGATLDAARRTALEFATAEALCARLALAAEMADWADVAGGAGAYLVRITDPTLDGPGRHRHVGPFPDASTGLAHAAAIRGELLDMLDGTDEEPWTVEVLPLLAPHTFAQPQGPTDAGDGVDTGPLRRAPVSGTS